jgi:hypothetical protein
MFNKREILGLVFLMLYSVFLFLNPVVNPISLFALISGLLIPIIGIFFLFVGSIMGIRSNQYTHKRFLHISLLVLAFVGLGLFIFPFISEMF